MHTTNTPFAEYAIERHELYRGWHRPTTRHNERHYVIVTSDKVGHILTEKYCNAEDYWGYWPLVLEDGTGYQRCKRCIAKVWKEST